MARTLFVDYSKLLLEIDVAKTTYPIKQYSINQNKEMADWYRTMLSRGLNLVFDENQFLGGDFDIGHAGYIGKQPPVGYSNPPIFIKPKELVGIVPKDSRFVITTNLADPRLVTIISSTISILPETSNFIISKLEFDNDSLTYHYRDFGKASILLKQAKTIKGKSSAYLEDSYEIFKFAVFKDLKEFDWYHATRKSKWQSIKQKGLVPSGLQDQGDGWTQFNLNLQAAVYLTKNIDFAYRIADTLAQRFEEDAIIIKVDGKALKNYTKIVADEDALRNDYDDTVTGYYSAEMFKDPSFFQRIPEFHQSVSDPKLASLGYKEIIPSSYITIYDTVKHEKDEE